MAAMPRYGAFCWDPDGDTGDGVIVGPFKTVKRAEQEATRLRDYADNSVELMECVIVRVEPGGIDGSKMLDYIQGSRYV